MIKRLLIIAILLVAVLIAVPCWGAFDINTTDCNDDDATTWCIQTTETTVTDADCGGTCSGGDTLYIEGGARGDLYFNGLDGGGSYITIKNDPTDRVVITETDTAGNGVLSFHDCKYIDVRGDNNVSFTYGIKAIGAVVGGDTVPTTGVVWVYGESDHVKLSYIEVDYGEGVTGTASSGIKVQDTTLSADWTFDTFEIHHNYVHDTTYSGLYTGHNCAKNDCQDECYPYNGNIQSCPYTANFNIHDNLFEDLGSYGLTLKGVEAGTGVNYITDNTIRRAGLTTTKGGEFEIGIGVSYFYGTTYAIISGNRTENTGGPGIYAREAPHIIYDNTILGAGTTDDVDGHWTHGLVISQWDTMTGETRDDIIQIYDNVIIQPVTYGIYSPQTEAQGLMARNIIAESGSDEWHNLESPGLVEGEDTSDCSAAWGSGPPSPTDCANVYDADTDNICFTTWSDDTDYSNDDFTLCCAYAYTSVGANLCGAAATPWSGVSCQGCVMN